MWGVSASIKSFSSSKCLTEEKMFKQHILGPERTFDNLGNLSIHVFPAQSYYQNYQTRYVRMCYKIMSRCSCSRSVTVQPTSVQMSLGNICMVNNARAD